MYKYKLKRYNVLISSFLYAQLLDHQTRRKLRSSLLYNKWVPSHDLNLFTYISNLANIFHNLQSIKKRMKNDAQASVLLALILELD